MLGIKVNTISKGKYVAVLTTARFPMCQSLPTQVTDFLLVVENFFSAETFVQRMAFDNSSASSQNPNINVKMIVRAKRFIRHPASQDLRLRTKTVQNTAELLLMKAAANPRKAHLCRNVDLYVDLIAPQPIR